MGIVGTTCKSTRRGMDALGLLMQDGRARESLVNNLLKEISYSHASLRNLGHPQIYELETTNACPYTCIMCPRTHAMTRPVGHMPIELFRNIIDQVRPAWQMDRIRAKPVMRLLHYGEPMVYPHYVESIDHCHRRGFSVYISTNPSVWTDKRIDETLDVGVDEMLVMVDGMDDATSIAIRGRAASFVRGERNIRELALRKVHRGLARPHITIAMIRQPRNVHQWELFENYWKDIDGIDATYLGHYSTFDGGVDEINETARQFADRDGVQAQQMAHQQRLSAYPCYYPWHSVSVTWEGQVVPCCRDYDASLVLGDLRKQTLTEIWNGPAMRRVRRNFVRGRWSGRPCETCTEASLEIGLPGRHYRPARWMRARSIGAMHRSVSRPNVSTAALVGSQNLNRDAYVRRPAAERKSAETVCS